jgi:hypothetical protein
VDISKETKECLENKKSNKIEKEVDFDGKKGRVKLSYEIYEGLLLSL